MTLRIGIDLGGTKISGIALLQGRGAAEVLEHRRIPTPKGDYRKTVETVAQLARELSTSRHARPHAARSEWTVGVGIPGSECPVTGKIQNANSTWLNGQPLASDLTIALERDVQLANDANCFALSEARDGAGVFHSSVFGVILGTGCGGGLVIDGQLYTGAMAIAGEWGHTPLPWQTTREHPGPQCWCGRKGCMETWVSGSGVERDFEAATGIRKSCIEIMKCADDGCADAIAARSGHLDRLARGLAVVVDIVDPDVIVLGGGLSQLPHLYEQLPELVARHVFADRPSINIVPPKWGDDSGVRGAAMLCHTTS